jgi:bacteriorhodopsin
MVEQALGLERIALGVGTAGMAFGTIAFIVMSRGAEGHRRRFYTVTTLVAAIATASYLLMFLGFGVAEVRVPDGFVLRIYWMRYVDWLLTTPLLLLDLALLAGADRGTVYRLVGLDVGMVLVGAAAAVAPLGRTPRLALWSVSSLLFVALLYVLANRLSERAAWQTDEVASLFGRLRNLVVVLWTAYPIVWIVGTESTIGLIPLGAETAAFAVLDLASKVGFGFVLLRSRSVLDRVSADATGAVAD